MSEESEAEKLKALREKMKAKSMSKKKPNCYNTLLYRRI
jgi:hypothetical protein